MSKFLVSNGCSRRVVCRQHQVASSANKKYRPKIASLRHISSAEPQSKLQILTANTVGSRFDFHFEETVPKSHCFQLSLCPFSFATSEPSWIVTFRFRFHQQNSNILITGTRYQGRCRRSGIVSWTFTLYPFLTHRMLAKQKRTSLHFFKMVWITLAASILLVKLAPIVSRSVLTPIAGGCCNKKEGSFTCPLDGNTHENNQVATTSEDMPWKTQWKCALLSALVSYTSRFIYPMRHFWLAAILALNLWARLKQNSYLKKVFSNQFLQAFERYRSYCTEDDCNIDDPTKK